eukprot:175904-Rhodomonas_salina.5
MQPIPTTIISCICSIGVDHVRKLIGLILHSPHPHHRSHPHGFLLAELLSLPVSLLLLCCRFGGVIGTALIIFFLVLVVEAPASPCFFPKVLGEIWTCCFLRGGSPFGFEVGLLFCDELRNNA